MRERERDGKSYSSQISYAYKPSHARFFQLCAWLATAHLVCFAFFRAFFSGSFQGYVMDRHIGFIEEVAKKPKYNTPLAQTPPVQHHTNLKASTHTLNNYSRHLHFSTGTSMPLNNLAARQSSASSEILRITTTLEGAMPSKTTSLR
jgi:hypothetical protein